MLMVRWRSVPLISIVATFQEHHSTQLIVSLVNPCRNNAQLLDIVTVLTVKNQIAEAVHRHQSAHIAPCLKHKSFLGSVLHPLHHLHHKVCVLVPNIVQSPLAPRVQITAPRVNVVTDAVLLQPMVQQSTHRLILRASHRSILTGELVYVPLTRVEVVKPVPGAGITTVQHCLVVILVFGINLHRELIHHLLDVHCACRLHIRRSLRARNMTLLVVNVKLVE